MFISAQPWRIDGWDHLGPSRVRFRLGSVAGVPHFSGTTKHRAQKGHGKAKKAGYISALLVMYIPA